MTIRGRIDLAAVDEHADEGRYPAVRIQYGCRQGRIRCSQAATDFINALLLSFQLQLAVCQCGELCGKYQRRHDYPV
ncbi:hypothetical protein WT09_02260 [Burkholderia stagnalis]|nr:hypothetical protein WT09_02260 [Burkholderia stagnalis]